MNGTVSFRERLEYFAEEALAWVVESGVLGAIPVLALLATILSHLK